MRALVLFVAVVLLAGCAGAPAATPASTTSASVPLGTITGRVLNDEQAAVAGAGIRLVEAGLDTVSGPDGGFRFDSVVIGGHTLQVEAAGYAELRQQVHVADAQTARVTLILTPVAAREPFIEVLPFEGYIQQGNQYLDVLTTTVGLNGCEKCRFYFNATGDVDVLVSEIQFTRTLDNPHGPEVLAYGLFTQDQSQRFTPPDQYWPSGGRFEVERRWGEEGEALLHTHGCDDLWICADQTFTNYVSLFHSQGVPEGYSALAKA